MPYSHLTNAVVSGEITEHEEAMMKAPVDVRDGDDTIRFSLPEEEENVDKVTIDTTNPEGEQTDEPETEDTDNQGEDTDTESEDSDSETSTEEEVTPEQLAERSESLEESSKAIQQAAKGQESIIKKAIEGGLPSEMVEVLQEQYNEHGELTEANYEALAAAGFDKSFVDSYIAGQEAINESFVKQVFNYAGGEAHFTKLSEFMASNHSDMAEAFNSAVARNDAITIKALLDTSKQLYSKSFGSKPERNLTGANVVAKATPKAAPKETGFADRNEMIKAMSDPRYIRGEMDFVKAVERKMMFSNF